MARARLLALMAAAAVAGCGSEDAGDPIPNREAREMEGHLAAVRAAVDEGRCESVPAAVSRLQVAIATLDEHGVGDDVQEALGDGADRLRGLAIGECRPEEEPVETTPVPPPPSETVPPPTETTPPPTETTPPPIEEPEEEPQPDEGDGGAQFDPDGGGKVPPGQAKKGDN